MTGLRVACIGAGYFSRFHYDSWLRMDRVELVGACDQDLDKARATGVQAYSDLSQMLSDAEPDVLDVILPPVVQTDAIRTAMSAGVKTIICQKPFCRSRAEAEAIVQEAEAAGVLLVVHENFRFQPWYRALKRELEAGRVGRLLQITFRLRPGDGQGADAYLDRQPYFQTMEKFLVHETAVHWIDTFRFLCGDPTAVYADLRRVNPVISGEDAGFILFAHSGGVRTLFDGNRCLDHASNNQRRTMGEALIEGDSGAITLRGDGSLWFRAFGAHEEHCLLAPDTWSGFGGDCVHELQTHVVAGILDGAPIENSGRAYLRVIEIEEAVYASAETGTKRSL
jgi:predicted dehydrogenase